MGIIQSMDKLAPNQLLAVEMLSNGEALTEVAEQLNIHRNSIYKWLNNPLFTEELNRAIDKKTSLLLAQGMQELEVILLHSPSNKEKLSAFQILLSMSDRYKPKTELTLKAEPIPSKNIDEILAELENII